jgi:undecaprenyl diphosphate synthase
MEDIPKHLAVILDGNRRWAKKKGYSKEKGHKIGAEKVDKIIDWCIELGIRQLTLYSFSVENFDRDIDEVDYLIGLFREMFKKISKDKNIDAKGVKVSIIGNKALFPEDIQEDFNEIEERTKDNDKITVNFCMGYGGRDEIIQACRKLIKEDVKDIDEETFRSYLFLQDYPDLLIRPGMEKRISNFLIWQLAYTELYFCDVLWPDFSKENLLDALEDFKKRQRRFGK